MNVPGSLFSIASGDSCFTTITLGSLSSVDCFELLALSIALNTNLRSSSDKEAELETDDLNIDC